MKLFLFAAAAAASFAAVSLPSAADARQGCGPGAHRGPRGFCRPNVGPGFAAPRYRPGRFYPGRGYYYRNRFYQHRYRYRNDWRYR